MDTKSHIKGGFFGYKALPDKSGVWGILLPLPKENKSSHEPSADDVIDQLNEAAIVFDKKTSLGDRGSVFALAVCVMVVFLNLALRMAMQSPHPENPPWVHGGLIALPVFLCSLAAIAAYRAKSELLPPPVIISRVLRKVFSWHDKRREWISLNYDDIVPATFRNKVITTSGSATVYVLTLCTLKPGSREIEYAVSPVPPRGHPLFCGEIWEFIRRYMEGSPEDLPPVRLLPHSDHPKSWMAWKDRAEFTDFIERDHRVKPTVFAYCVVYFWGSVGYWWDRAAGWIERTAPRVPLPPEVVALPTSDDTPYKTVPLTDTEQAAVAGTLPQLRRRWLICGTAGTLIWGVMFGLLIVSVWV